MINCFFFLIWNSGTWIERGRGTLRLNDKKLDNGIVQSRLVMRTQGSLRVILNTKVRLLVNNSIETVCIFIYMNN